MKLEEVHVAALTPDRLLPLIGPERAERFEATASAAREMLTDRAVLNVNSTASGGGVAEMLRSLLAYARGAGVDAQWLVIEGDPHFFEITKRIHNNLHGAPGDGGPLGADERRHYEDVLRANADELLALLRPRDIVLLHDPQTAGLAHALARAGAIVVWRCHVGADAANEHVDRAWAFLRPSPRGRRRLRVHTRGVHAGLGRPAAHGRDPSLDRPVLGQEPGNATDGRRRRPALRRAPRGRASSARRRVHTRGRIDGSHQPSRRRAPDRSPATGGCRRSSSRCRGGIP